MHKRLLFIVVFATFVSSWLTPPALWAAATGADRAHVRFSEIMAMLESGNTEMLALLLKSTPRAAQVTDENGATPLHVSAFQGRKRPIELLLACGDSLAKTDSQGWTPLHYAVAGKRLHSVLFLLEKGADCNMADQHGNTPIFFAVANKQAGVVKALLKHGARTDLKNTSGESPITWAQGSFQAFCRRLFAANAVVPPPVVPSAGTAPSSPPPLQTPSIESQPAAPSETPARQAALMKPTPADQRMIDMLRRDEYSDLLAIVTETPDLARARDPEGATLLHAAAFLGKTEFAKHLLSMGLPVGTADRQGWTPLHYAVAGDQEETVRFLLTQGADPFARDAKNLSPVRMAGWGSSKRLAGLLLHAVAQRRQNSTNEYRLADARSRSFPTAGSTTAIQVSYQADTPIAQGLSQASWTPSPDRQPRFDTCSPRHQQATVKNTISPPPAPSKSRRNRSFLLAVPVAVLAALAMHG